MLTAAIFFVIYVAVTGLSLPGAAVMNVVASPNPFNPRTEISFDLAEEAPLKLAVFNLAGRMVRLFDEGVVGPGRRTIGWDGTDGRGRRLASGTYLVMVQAGDVLAGTKVALVQ